MLQALHAHVKQEGISVEYQLPALLAVLAT